MLSGANASLRKPAFVRKRSYGRSRSKSGVTKRRPKRSA
jgi:hypothetical protein